MWIQKFVEKETNKPTQSKKTDPYSYVGHYLYTFTSKSGVKNTFHRMNMICPHKQERTEN